MFNLDRREFLTSAANLCLLSAQFNTEITFAQETPQIAKSELEIMQSLLPASVQLRIETRNGINTGSGTLINPPESLKPLLSPGQFLIVSASHVFEDFNQETDKLTALTFDEFDQDLKPKKSKTFKTSLLNRYLKGSEDPKTSLIDISFCVMEVPLIDSYGKRNPLIARLNNHLVKLAPLNNNPNKGDELIALGFPQQADGKVISTFRKGSFIRNTEASEKTNFGTEINLRISSTLSAIPGESGGSLFNKNFELVGICSGGEKTGLDFLDFPIPDLEKIVLLPEGASTEGFSNDVTLVRNLDECLEAQKKLAKKHGFSFALNSPWRSEFQSVKNAYDLADILVRDNRIASKVK